MTKAQAARFAAAANNLRHAVADLAEQDRLLQIQDNDLAAAERDGNLIVFRDWCAAVKAVAAASAEYDLAENEMEGD